MTLHYHQIKNNKKRMDCPISKIFSTSKLRISDFGPIFCGIVTCKADVIKCGSFWMYMFSGYLTYHV